MGNSEAPPPVSLLPVFGLLQAQTPPLGRWHWPDGQRTESCSRLVKRRWREQNPHKAWGPGSGSVSDERHSRTIDCSLTKNLLLPADCVAEHVDENLGSGTV